MTKPLLLLAGLLVFMTLATDKASAHFLATDGSIGAVLHVDPDDDPIIGQQSSFFFEVKDTATTFDITNCDCRGVILQDSNEIYSQAITTAESNTSSFAYVFQKSGVYTVQMQGTPLQENSFSPFTLSWDIRVERGDTSVPTKNNFITFVTKYSVELAILLIGSIAIGYQIVRSSTRHP